jgi:hypothetical protein
VEPNEEPVATPLDFWVDRWPFGLLLVVLLVSVVTPILTAIFWGNANTWPSLSTGFAATAIAFLVALAWDRRQREAADRKEAEAEARRIQAAKLAEQEHRESEARRRFSAIALELERLQGSLQRTVDEQHLYKYFFPDLPSGSWQAGRGGLGTILENFGLMADLSTFYGHVEELQWRLRFKAESGVDENAVSPIIEALARQMLNDVAVLLAQVRRQVANPDVTPIEGADAGGFVVARRQQTGAIRAVDFRRGPATEPEPQS